MEKAERSDIPNIDKKKLVYSLALMYYKDFILIFLEIMTRKNSSTGI